MTRNRDGPTFPWPSDGVEIKFSFSGPVADAVLASFDLEEATAERMTIPLFDALMHGAEMHGAEPRFRLLDQGLVLRARLPDDGSEGDTTLELRPADGARLTGNCQPGTEHHG